MHLYHFTALSASTPTHLAHGSFTAPRQQELILCTNNALELYRLHPKTSLLQPLFRVDAFAQIRALDTFRLPGTRRDFLVVTSDAGSVSILAADASAGSFNRIHCEPFGKSGARRAVPGAFLSAEPHGRACMLAAFEKSKLAYVLNRDPDENVTISSPLEAHKSSFVTHALTSLDVGFENPMFASIERSYELQSEKLLVYYELDLGLNQVVRKMTATIKPESNLLLRVPGGSDGPGGVLVCSEGWVAYRNLLEEDDHGNLLSLNSSQSHNPQTTEPGTADTPTASIRRLEARIPHRDGTDGTSLMVVAGTAYHDRKRNAFFFLLSTETGDLIKVELSWQPDKGATALKLFYFDTLPAPAVAMCIFRSGYLAAAVEGGETFLLLFREVNVPSNDPAGGFSSSETVAQGQSSDGNLGQNGKGDQLAEGLPSKANGFPSSTPKGPRDKPMPANLTGTLRFHPKAMLSRLTVAAVIDSFGPILSMCNSRGSGIGYSSSLICATGRSRAGSVWVVRRGMGVLEMSQPQQLASKVTEVFSCKKDAESAFHRLIVVSFESKTKVLEVGEAKLEETVNSGLDLEERTLAAGQIGEDSFVQVTKAGVRFVRGANTSSSEWKPPIPGVVVAGCCNQQQVVVILSSGTIVYFEMDSSSGSLEELAKIPGALQLNEDVDFANGDVGIDVGRPSVAIPEIPPGRKKSAFFAAGDGISGKVRIFQICDDNSIEPLGLHIAPAPVESIALVDFGIMDKEAIASTMRSSKILSNATSYEPLLTLVIGTRHGALVRLKVDAVTGILSTKRSQFLGERPVHVKYVKMSGIPTCLLMGSSTWLLFLRGGRVTMSPLCTDPMEHAAAFALAHSPDGFVVTHGSKLRLLSLESINAIITSASLPHGLSVTAVPSSTVLDSSFTVSRTRTASTPRRILRVAKKQNRPWIRTVQNTSDAANDELVVIIETDYNYPMGSVGSMKWNSRLRLARISDVEARGDVDEDEDPDAEGVNPLLNTRPTSFETLDTLKMNDDECVLAAASLSDFGSEASNSPYVVLSQAVNLGVSGTSPKSVHCERSGPVLDENTEKPKVTSSLSVYKVDTDANRLIFLHKTNVAEPVQCLVAFRDMLLVGIGGAIRLYDLGKQQLLRKGEFKLAVRNKVAALAVSGGDRIFVGDVSDSVTLFKYLPSEPVAINQSQNAAPPTARGGHFVPMAGDSVPRWVVTLEALDYNTVSGSDKFGNVFILRVPSVLGNIDGDVSVSPASMIEGTRTGTNMVPHKLAVEASYHIGTMATSLVRGSFAFKTMTQLGKDMEDEALLYGTMSGTIGVLAPMRTQNDIDFARALEKEMRARQKSICGRDHMSYRSSFYPSKNVVDGDVCRMFTGMSSEDREKCAASLGRSVEDIDRKLEELQSSYV